MYRNIVVGYDGSHEAHDALALAGLLRGEDGVVTAAGVPSEGGEPSEAPEAGPWLQTRTLAPGARAPTLLGLLEESGADLFAVGSSSRAPAGRTRTGPVGHRVLNGSPCPVAVAPRGFRHRSGGIRSVAIAFETIDEVADVVGDGAELARDLGAQVRLLCVVAPIAPWALAAGRQAGYSRADIERDHHAQGSRIVEAATALLPDARDVDCRLLEGRPAEVLAREVERGVDLLVMPSRGGGVLPRVRLSAVSLEVMRSAPCPVVVMPHGASADPGGASLHSESARA
jgi:nucleotide-binding universal stress UspA family protein